MRILIDILHPAHVHFFRPFIGEMTARGHEFLLLSRDKDITVELLNAFGLEHEVVSRQRTGAVSLLTELGIRIAAILRHSRSFQPDYLMGLMGPAISIAGKLVPARSIVFYDNETSLTLNQIVARLVDAWWSPRAYRLDHGAHHHRYPGYHELAYLHPNRFSPDASVLRRYDIDASRPYLIVRFVSWQSVHDFGESGFSYAGKLRLVEQLARHGRVLITSEGALPPELEPYRSPVAVEDIHHLLAFATLLVSESSTMASEAAILGTHAVFVSRSGRGVNDEQEARYGLVHNFNGGTEEQALRCVSDLLQKADLKPDALERRQRLLADTIDVTASLVSYIESREANLPGFASSGSFEYAHIGRAEAGAKKGP